MSIGLKVKAGERYRPVIHCTEDKFTVQSARDECDINRIVARFEKSGILPTIDRVGIFVDVSNVGDYREALERVETAREAFMRLPAVARERFDNDPATFLDFMADPANEPEAVKLGLVAPKAPEAPAPAAGGASTPS